MSSEMEEAANNLGAARLRTLVRITLPLVSPALVGTWILTFLEAISIVGSTVIVALPARINLVPLQLLQFFGYPLQVEVAAAFAMPLLLLTVATSVIQRRLLRRKGFATLTGKGGERRLIALGRLRWAALGGCLAVLALSVGLPYLVLVEAAFAKVCSRGFALSNWTIENFSTLLFDQTLLPQSFLNTFTYAFSPACLAVGFAVIVADAIARRLVPLGQVLSVLCMTPFVVPGLVLAIGFYAAFGLPPLALAGTAAIMILAFSARFLPIAFTSATASIRGMDPELESARAREAVWRRRGRGRRQPQPGGRGVRVASQSVRLRQDDAPHDRRVHSTHLRTHRAERRRAVVHAAVVPPERRGMSMIFQSYAIRPSIIAN